MAAGNSERSDRREHCVKKCIPAYLIERECSVGSAGVPTQIVLAKLKQGLLVKFCHNIMQGHPATFSGRLLCNMNAIFQLFSS